MEMIGHQDVGQNMDAAKSLQASHELDKTLGLSRTMTRGLENEAAVYGICDQRRLEGQMVPVGNLLPVVCDEFYCAIL